MSQKLSDQHIIFKKGYNESAKHYYWTYKHQNWARNFSSDQASPWKIIDSSGNITGNITSEEKSGVVNAIDDDIKSRNSWSGSTHKSAPGGTFPLVGKIGLSISATELNLGSVEGKIKPPQTYRKAYGSIRGHIDFTINGLGDESAAYTGSYPDRGATIGCFRCAWFFRIFASLVVGYKHGSWQYYRVNIGDTSKPHPKRAYLWQKTLDGKGCLFNGSNTEPRTYDYWTNVNRKSGQTWNEDLGDMELSRYNFKSSTSARHSVETWEQDSTSYTINGSFSKNIVKAFYEAHKGENKDAEEPIRVYLVVYMILYSPAGYTGGHTDENVDNWVIAAARYDTKVKIHVVPAKREPEVEEWTETKEEKKIVVIHYNIAQSPNTPPADTTSLITITTTIQHRTVDGVEDDGYPKKQITKVIQPHTLTSEIPQYPFHQIYHIQSFDQNGVQISSSANGRVDNWLSDSGVPTYTLNVTRTFEFVMWLDEANKTANWTYSIVKRGPGQSAELYPGRVFQPNEIESLIYSMFFTETSPGTYNGQQYDTVYEATLYACWSTVYIDWLPKESDLNLTDGYRLDPTSPWTYTPDYDLQIASETDSVPEQASQIDLYANFTYRLRLYANGGQFTDCYDASYTINGSNTTISDDPHYWEQSNGIDPYKKETWLRRYTPYQLTDKVVHLTSTFLGWSKNKDATSPSYYFKQSVTMPPPIDLYAVWQLKEFNVYFRTGYGNNNLITTVKVKYGAGVPANQIPVYGQGSFYRRSDNYVFTGWSGTFLHVCSDIVVEGLWAWSPIWVMQDGRWIPYRPHDSNLLQ